MRYARNRLPNVAGVPSVNSVEARRPAARRSLRTVGQAFLQTASDDPFQFFGHVTAQCPHRRRRLIEHGCQQLDHVLAGKRRLACQQIEERDADGVDVAAQIERIAP